MHVKKILTAALGAGMLRAALAPGSVRAAVLHSSDIRVGNRVEFGRWEQDEDSSGEEPLYWKVLEKKDDEVLLITEDVVVNMPFHTETGDTNWDECYLRHWLNVDNEYEPGFYYTAFNDSEKNDIQWTTIETSVDKKVDSDGILETSDYLYLLNADEAKKYFDKKSERIAKVSPRLKKEADDGDDEDEDNDDDNNEEESEDDANAKPSVSEYSDGIFWWLRSQGKENDLIQCVGAEGYIADQGFLAQQAGFGVRPVMWVRTD